MPHTHTHLLLLLLPVAYSTVGEGAHFDSSLHVWACALCAFVCTCTTGMFYASCAIMQMHLQSVSVQEPRIN